MKTAWLGFRTEQACIMSSGIISRKKRTASFTRSRWGSDGRAVKSAPREDTLIQSLFGNTPNSKKPSISWTQPSSENPQFQTPAGFPVTALACPTEKENVLVLLSRIPKDIFDSAGKGQNEVVTLIFDSQKNIANFKRATLDFAVIAQPAACHYTFSILPPGDYECRVIIRNLETGQTAVAREPVRIPEASDLPLALLPPLLLRPGSDIYYFGVQKTQGEEANANTMSLTSLFPFDAKQFAPLLGELQGGSPKINAMVICALGDILEPELELSFFLKKDPSGSEIPITHSILSAKRYSRDEDNRSWLALLSQLEFSDLKPGSYILKARARETTTNCEAESVQKLDVK